MAEGGEIMADNIRRKQQTSMPIGNRRKCEEILRTHGNRIFLLA